MAMQQYRIVRLVMVLAIVALTVFLYVSYYANTAMTVPGRIHNPAALLSNFNDNSIVKMINNNDIGGTSNRIITTGDGGGSKGPNEQRMASSQIIGSEDTNSSFAQQYSDVNVLVSSVQPNTSDLKIKNIEKSQKASNNTSLAPSQGGAIASSAPGNQPDPSRGIRTADLYEAGHTEPNTDLCQDSGEFLRLLILITSAPTHQEARLAIRQTWGYYTRRKDISIGFVLGATQTQAIDDALSAESDLYGDLIRGRFIDSYNNLTLKTISSLEWIDTYCPKVKFILKTDDDMFINVPRLLTFIEKHQKDTKMIYGRLAKKWKPIRNKKSKYYVSPQQYFPPVFPQFTTGPAYLITGDVVHGLYAKALNQTYLKLEDVFTTGIVAQLVNVKRAHVNEFLNRRIAFNPCNIRKAISVHMVKANEQFDLWKKLLDQTTKCK